MLDETYDHLTDEFKRLGLTVSTSHRGDKGRIVTIDGWPQQVEYDQTKALPVLQGFEDGHASTDWGDAEVCAALEKAGAVVRVGP